MSLLMSVSIDLDKINKEKIYKGKKGMYYNLTISVNDEARVFENPTNGKKTFQNVSVFDAQSKEEVDAKKTKHFLGNGGVFWNNGTVVNARDAKESGGATPKSASSSSSVDENDDLPF